MFGLEKLEVWQKAIDFADSVYNATKRFPREELSGITMQMRRASASISLNIAEGTSRTSPKDQAHLEIAYGSVTVVVSAAHLACRQDHLDEQQVKAVRSDAMRLCRMLSGLRKSALARAK